MRNEDSEVVFELDLPEGKSLLESWFVEGDQGYGVYYTYIEKISAYQSHATSSGSVQ